MTEREGVNTERLAAELSEVLAKRDALASELAAAVALGEAAPEKLAAHDKRIAALKADTAAAHASSTEAGINRRLASAAAALDAAKAAEGQAILALLVERQTVGQAVAPGKKPTRLPMGCQKAPDRKLTRTITRTRIYLLT